MAFDVHALQLSPDDLKRSIDLLTAHNVKLFAVLTENATTKQHVAALGILDVLPTVAPRAKTAKAAPAPIETAVEPVVAGPDEAASADASVAIGELAQARDAGVARPALDEEQEHGTDGLLIKKRVRGGQLFTHPGHIVIVGDVNPGAQIVAGGDIIVWGKLQGSAHAGAFGDTSAVVCALELTPAMIKIAELAIRNHRGKAEMARIKEQEIIFSKWDNKS